jgi:hypothetical protein
MYYLQRIILDLIEIRGFEFIISVQVFQKAITADYRQSTLFSLVLLVNVSDEEHQPIRVCSVLLNVDLVAAMADPIASPPDSDTASSTMSFHL